jgi:hypothetical protein
MTFLLAVHTVPLYLMIRARDRARVGVWLLTTLLTTMVSWRVAALMPWAVAAGVWFVAASTVLGGYYTLFLLPRAGQ